MTEKERILLYQRTFSGEHGKKMMEELEELTGYNNVIQPKDANALFYHTGRRDLITQIKEVLLLDANDYEESNGTNDIDFIHNY